MTQGLANTYTVKTIYRTLDRLTKRSADNIGGHITAEAETIRNLSPVRPKGSAVVDISVCLTHVY